MGAVRGMAAPAYFVSHAVTRGLVMPSIKLYFVGEQKEIPLKNIISRRIIKAVENPIATLRSLGQNAAFQKALQESPNAAKIVTLSGGANSVHAAQIGKEIREAIPNITDSDLQSMVTQRIQSELLESFPNIWQALNNPITEFPLDNDDAINACIEVLKVIMDLSQLTEEQKTLMSVSEFWEDQDLTEVVESVKWFRGVAKL